LLVHKIADFHLSFCLQAFLQIGFVIDCGRARDRLFYDLGKGAHDETPRRFRAAVQIDGADQGFERVGNDGGTVSAAAVLFALSEVQKIAELKGGGYAKERFFTDDIRSEPRQRALFRPRKPAVQFIADQPFQNGVAEKFKSLIAGEF
jgi:hypothetical protein